MDIREPEIKKDEILILNDQDFCRENICIVTGCGTGIGRATAIAAAANNLTTLGLDINQIQGEKTCEMVRALGGSMTFLKTDLTRDKEIEIAVARAAALGQIKDLVNIAEGCNFCGVMARGGRRLFSTGGFRDRRQSD